MISPAGERRTIASQLAAALEQYDRDLQPLARGYDPERYTKLANDFDRLRSYAASLPELSVPWVAVLISRAELSFQLFKAHRDPLVRTALAACIERHRAAAQELRGHCDGIR